MLTSDHKPDRPDERRRVLAAGGQVGSRQLVVGHNAKGPVTMPMGPARVWYTTRGETMGLAMSRSLGTKKGGGGGGNHMAGPLESICGTAGSGERRGRPAGCSGGRTVPPPAAGSPPVPPFRHARLPWHPLPALAARHSRSHHALCSHHKTRCECTAIFFCLPALFPRVRATKRARARVTWRIVSLLYVMCLVRGRPLTPQATASCTPWVCRPSRRCRSTAATPRTAS